MESTWYSAYIIRFVDSLNFRVQCSMKVPKALMNYGFGLQSKRLPYFYVSRSDHDLPRFDISRSDHDLITQKF